MRRTIKPPKYGASRTWPQGVVTIEQIETPYDSWTTFNVYLDGEVVGQIERHMASHSIKIKGSRLSRGLSKPRPEWKVVYVPWKASIGYEYANKAINRLYEDRARDQSA